MAIWEPAHLETYSGTTPPGGEEIDFPTELNALSVYSRAQLHAFSIYSVAGTSKLGDRDPEPTRHERVQIGQWKIVPSNERPSAGFPAGPDSLGPRIPTPIRALP